MKLNRLLEITSVLLNRKSVTAAELAERFGVSVRTIYRDIDVLSSSGVPVYASQGKNGDIALIEDYTVSRAALTDSERDSVLAALQTLQSTKYPQVDVILNKLGGIFKSGNNDWISVDFSPWGANPNANNKFSNIRNAILRCRIIKIDYINAKNEKSSREIEPLRLLFKSQAWYMEGWDLTKNDYRMFRLSRIKKAEVSDRVFDKSKLRLPAAKADSEPNKDVVPPAPIVLQFTEEAHYRLCDDYDDEQIIKNPDGTYTLTLFIGDDEWVYGYIMSFGPFVKVLEPEHIRQTIKERCEKILGYYT